MRTPRALRTAVAPAAAGLAVAGLAVAGLGLAGCAAPERPEPAVPSVTARPTPVPVPADGLLLGAFGVTGGLRNLLSLPAAALPTTVVDQPANVTLVLAQPPAAAVHAYLLQTLRPAGWTVTADDAAASTLTFTGHGWTGSFTGSGSTSALVLRPG